MDFADHWANKNEHDKRQIIQEFVKKPQLLSGIDFLSIVCAPESWGVYASNGPNFKYAIFGRDSIIVADDVLTTHKDLVSNIIHVLAILQGTSTNDNNEEEPGKIHHEYRALKFGEHEVPPYSQGIMNNLQRQWGNEGSDNMVYYGSYDATPMYVRLVCKYVEFYSDSILAESYIGRDNQSHTIRDSLRFAIGWLTYKINESSSGLLEYKRFNPHGIENQAWKDSRTGYLRRDGAMPNFDKGIASIELQGYTYDALMYGSKIVAENKSQADYWASLAASISDKVLKWYWMDDVNYFAQALDYDDNNKRRQIDTLTSNGALILNSQLLSNTNPEDRDYIVANVAKTICSEEFLTKAGIRSRSLRHISIPGFIDYHGSYTVWPKETNEIAKGLRFQGLNQLASRLEMRIIDAIINSSEFVEFNYADNDDRVWYDTQSAIKYFNFRSPGGNIPIPESGQAWSISSFNRICLADHYGTNTPVHRIEESILSSMPDIANPFD